MKRLTVLIIALVHSSAVASLQIDTTSSWTGTSSTGQFNGSLGYARAAGQTFVVTGDNILDDFSFFVEGPGILITGYVMEWDGEKTSGPILYQSAPQITSPQIAPTDFVRHIFSTGGLTLEQGHTYVAFVDAGDIEQFPFGFRVGFTSGRDAYASGKFFGSSFSADSFAELSTIPWNSRSTDPTYGDAAFIANFSSAIIPEPASFSTWALLFLSVAAARFRCRFDGRN